jgi:hypothetical protein
MFSILCKGNSSELTIYACYSWEMVLNVSLDAPLFKTENKEGIKPGNQ